MSSPLTHEIYANAARSLSWSPHYRVAPSDLTYLIVFHRLEIAWTDGYVMVKQDGGPGHVERFSAGGEADALFTAVVMCAALIGGAA